jgi:hypothetical protein
LKKTRLVVGIVPYKLLNGDVAKHQVESALLLDVVVSKGTAILKLLAS